MCEGVDINPYCVEYCKGQLLNVKKMRAEDVGKLKKNKYDTILFSHVLEHLSNPWKVVRSCHKLLKKGGKVVIAIPGKVGYESDSTHKTFLHIKSFDWLEGFKVIKRRYYPFNSKCASDRLKHNGIIVVLEKE